MSLRCALCHRSMASAATWAAGYPVGPKCARRAGLIEKAPRKTKPDPATRVEDGQAELFEDLKHA